MSKIACFVAMPHHSRFLIPVLDKLEAQGHEVVYFTTLSDFPYEQEPFNRGKKTRVLQEYMTPEIREKIRATEKTFYPEYMNRMWDNPKLVQWPLNLQSALFSSEFEDFWLTEAFLKAEKPDLIMVLHERNRWGKQLGYWSNELKIPMVQFQEGDFYDDRLSYTTHNEYTTAHFVWGQASKDFLLRHGNPAERIYLVGNTHLDNTRKLDYDHAEIKREMGLDPSDKRPIALFLISVYWGMVSAPELWHEVWDQFPWDECQVVASWHPKIVFNSFVSQFKPMLAEHFPQLHIKYGYDVYKLIDLADYVVGFGKSTTAVEVAWRQKPFFSIKDHRDERDTYAEWGIGIDMEPGQWEKFRGVLRDGVSTDYCNKRDQFLRNYFYENNTQAITRAVELINVMLDEAKKEHNDLTVTGDWTRKSAGMENVGFKDEEARLRFWTAWHGRIKKDSDYFAHLKRIGWDNDETVA